MLTERQNQYLDYLIEPASKSFQEKIDFFF